MRPLHEVGVVGFTCFLLASGVPEFPPLDDAGLRAALAELAAMKALLVAHVEDGDVIAAAPELAGPSYAAFLASWPRAARDSRGRDADLVAFAPDEPWTVGELARRNPVTPCAGRELCGRVRRTWLRGRPTDGAPAGRLLSRGDARGAGQAV